jgi:hypothetical protein
VEKVQAATFGMAEERIAWEGLASSCSQPLKRLAAFLLVGFVVWVALTSAVTVVYNLFGERSVAGQGVAVPASAYYATMLLSLGVAVGGFVFWIWRSRKNYASFVRVLRRGGIDHERPTARGLRVYSDEQLLALRSRYEHLRDGRLKRLFEEAFGFSGDDDFSLGPLSVLPRTFEMGVLRMGWEANLLLAGDRRPAIGWWTESRHGLLPRRTDGVRRLLYALRYTGDSVRRLKRLYGYRANTWHATVPEGKLFDAVRDYEEARRIEAALNRRSRARR